MGKKPDAGVGGTLGARLCPSTHPRVWGAKDPALPGCLCWELPLGGPGDRMWGSPTQPQLTKPQLTQGREGAQETHLGALPSLGHCCRGAWGPWRGLVTPHTNLMQSQSITLSPQIKPLEIIWFI